jgi:hypothetical protein
VFAPAHSVLGSYAVCAAALSVLGIAASQVAHADVASNLTRAASAVEPAARAARAVAGAPARAVLHMSAFKRPLALELPPRRAISDVPEPRSVASAAAGERFAAAFPIHWQRDEPQIFRTARAFRRQGLPLVHLWQSDSGEHMLSIGLNSHGVPGIWLTQKVPD